MVMVGLLFDVIPGKEREFEGLARHLMHSMEGFEGHRRSRLVRDVEEGGTYIILSDWEDKDEFDTFATSEAFHDLAIKAQGALLKRPPYHRTYVDHHLAPRSAAHRHDLEMRVY